MSPVSLINNGAQGETTSFDRYIQQRGGTRRIRRVLIANNGMAACKFIRSIRSWSLRSFHTASAIDLVAMCSEDDLSHGSAFIELADSIVTVAGGPSSKNYGNVELIVSVAKEERVDAVWAGWGHASENPELPKKLIQANIAFIGPRAESMQALGDKISSTIIAQSSGVNCIRWSGSDIQVQPDKDGIIRVEESDFKRACIESPKQLSEKAAVMGFPLMIKASEGGGGKGIRLVEHAEDLERLFEQVCKELPGSPVFLMGLCREARHLEIQIVADEYGDTVALYGRDCTVQRRHQKIIEEAPIVAASDQTIRAMEKAAIDMARSVAYHNAGTVEFLYQPATDQYFFLELNPRLQVEHPTTEQITGINLPAVQLQIAMGIPLKNIPDIRVFYGHDPDGTDSFSLDMQGRQPPHGHVIATRLTAENPHSGFKPSGGRIEELRFDSPGPNTWGYFSLRSGSSTHDYSDSQFGHIFAWGVSREEARLGLLAALSSLTFRGTFQSTTEALVDLLQREEFQSLTNDTRWLDSLIASGSLANTLTLIPIMDVALCVATWRGQVALEKARQEGLLMLKNLQIPQRQQLKRSIPVEFIYRGQLVRLACDWGGPGRLNLRMNGVTVKVSVLQDDRDSRGMLVVQYAGQMHAISCWSDTSISDRFLIDGRTCTVQRDADPSIIQSPSSGKLIRYRVSDGDTVVRGQRIAEIEVMKMCLEICAEESGRIRLSLSPGATLKANTIIARLDLGEKKGNRSGQGDRSAFDDPPRFGARGGKAKSDYSLSQGIEQSIFGHVCGVDDGDDMKLERLYEVYCKDTYVSSMIEYHLAATDRIIQGPLLSIQKLSIDRAISVLERAESPSLESLLRELRVIQRIGPEGCLLNFVQSCCDTFIKHATLFDSFGTTEEAIEAMRMRNVETEEILEGLFLQCAIEGRSACLLRLLNDLIALLPNAVGTEQMQSVLRGLADLRSAPYSRVGRKARELLFNWQLPTFEELRDRMESKFVQALSGSSWSAEREQEFIEDMVRGFSTHLDVLPHFFHHASPVISQLALEIYIRRISESYQLCGIERLRKNDENDVGDRGLLWYFASLLSTDLHIERDAILSPAVSVVQNDGTARDHEDPADPKAWEGLRCGTIMAASDFDSTHRLLPRLAGMMQKAGTSRNVLYLVVNLASTAASDTDETIQVHRFERALGSIHAEVLAEGKVRRVTLVIVRRSTFPSLGFYTFRQSLGFREDCTIRHLDPSMAYLLEFNRLINYDVRFCHADPSGQIHIYHALPKQRDSSTSDKKNKEKGLHERLFVRLVIRPNQAMRHFNSINELLQEVYRILEETFEAVEAVLAGLPPGSILLCNHLFFNVLPVFVNTASQAEDLFRTIMGRYNERVKRLNFRQGEIKMNLATARGAPATRHRFILSNETGHCLRIDGFFEERDPISGHHSLRPLQSIKRRQSFLSEHGTSHLLQGGDHNPQPSSQPQQVPASAPYPATLDDIQVRRYRVQSTMGTSYVYDFPLLFTQAISELNPKVLILFEEGFLDPTSRQLTFCSRPMGQNKCGMVGWRCLVRDSTTRTAEFVIIGNDISFEIGSFGVEEDQLFYELSAYARTRRLPRIFLSANSGARIGLADEVFRVMRIAWLDESNPGRGFSYLYLTEEDLSNLPPGVVQVVPVDSANPPRFRITDIIGAREGLGVENLSGSALIAGETARAYDDSFTLTLVTGRSVGIGAYLVRLGQRAIQKHDQPIILTGHAALNAVLGREVYQNNLQLGGPHIMHANGVSHLVVKDDWEGVREAVRWLGYLPGVIGRLVVGSSSGQSNRSDDTDLKRPMGIAGSWRVQETSPTVDRDPRILLAGKESALRGDWQGGLLDRGSFQEYLAGWARSVVVGRGRLGGRPLGIIATELRSTERICPADPANAESRATVTAQAGQVWFPDSAHKTAQALRDFAREGLSVLILASWRGFSGGQRDLFEEILKFGSMIVEALAVYPLPVLVYLPPGAELRGGSWVVLDSKINAGGMIEMYADPHSRGGILEPEGVVGVKIRRPQLEELADRSGIPKNDPRREALLSSVFHQAAIHFADLHDTAGRMLAKGVIRAIVPLASARLVLGQRLARRLLEIEEGILIHDVPELSGCFESDSKFLEHVLPNLTVIQDRVRARQAGSNNQC